MKTFFLTFLGGLAALVFFFLLLPLALILTVASSAPAAPRGQIALALDLRPALADQPAADGFAFLSGPSFVETLLKLNAAIADDKVAGVYVRASEFEMGSSRAEELRAAFGRLQSAGKFVVAHSQGFYASGPSAYRAVSAADELWIQPSAPFEVPGLTFETLFFGEILADFKVTPEIEQIREYKNAADVYKQTGYTEAHAEAMRSLATSVWDQSIADIAADRALDPARVRELLESSPHLAEEAVAFGLADQIGWPEDVEKSVIDRVEGGLVDIADYEPPASSADDVIAVVGGEGPIVTGAAGSGDVFSLGSAAFVSDQVAANLLALVEDADVDAVVFRVDSPGGSPTASDQVWRAVERLKEAGKPVVVSMGSVAASGGYYVSAGADAIVANGSTITGSIGIFGGKFALAEALREFGVNPATISVGGPYADAYSLERFTNEQRAELVDALEDVYGRFTQLVADGRGLTVERVDELGGGRIWSGQQASENGLVDIRGDLIAAVEEAKRLAKLAPEDEVEIRLMVDDRSPFEVLSELMVSADGDGAAALAASLSGRGAEAEVLSALVGDRRAAAALQLAQALRADPRQLAIPVIVER